MRLIESCPSRFAILTGGEPTLTPEVPGLIGLLKASGFEIAMESNGQFAVPQGIDFLTVSPKRWASRGHEAHSHPPFWIHPKNSPSELKLVVDDEMVEGEIDSIYHRWEKGEFTFRDPGIPRFYLSPEWGALERTSKKVFSYIQKHPQWRLSIQSHKVLNIP